MIAFYVALCLGVFTFVRSEDPLLSVVKEVIYEGNAEIDKENKSEVFIPDFKFENLLVKVDLSNGRLGTFNTLVLRGDEQFINQTDHEDYSVIMYDLLLGLEQLKLHYEYNYRILFGQKSGIVDATGTGNTFRARGTIISHDSGACEAYLEQVEIVKLGKFKVSVQPSGLVHWIMKHMAEIGANVILPVFKPAINALVAEIVRVEVPKTDFAKKACKPFEINI